MASIQIYRVFARSGLKTALSLTVLVLKIGLERVVKASIGPTTSEVLRSYDLLVDPETFHPKMGFLVKEAAELDEALLQQIRSHPRRISLH